MALKLRSGDSHIIVFEGILNSGKGSLIEALRIVWPERYERTALSIRHEPLDRITLPANAGVFSSDPALYFAHAAQCVDAWFHFVAENARPGLDIFIDRGLWSFDLYGRGMDGITDQYHAATNAFLRRLLPDPHCTVLLDVPANKAFDRGVDRGDRFDLKGIKYHAEIRARMLDLALQVPSVMLPGQKAHEIAKKAQCVVLDSDRYSTSQLCDQLLDFFDMRFFYR